jgi:leucyl aminopeptidase
MQPEVVCAPGLSQVWNNPTGNFDALVLVSGFADDPAGRVALAAAVPEGLWADLEQTLAVDAAAGRSVGLVRSAGAPSGRLVLAPTGPLHRDHDDVRQIGEAAARGMLRARDAGSVRPLLAWVGLPNGEVWARAAEVILLAAQGALWEPLEARESLGESVVEPVVAIGFCATGAGTEADLQLAARVHALEAGRRLARDITGTEPERMSPPRMAELLVERFAGTSVKVEVLSDPTELSKGYPLLMAVARASMGVVRHQPRVVRLTWEGEGENGQTLYFAGKGLSYDTGGADLKTDGHMAGMSRDKGGAGAVAGLVLAAALLKPRGIRIVAELGCVRNSIGSDAFVSDEIIVSRAGCRVRIGNTDAEGRLVLADLLASLREMALDGENAHLFSVATLTGHAGRAVGPYTLALDNGPARGGQTAARLEAAGDLWGEGMVVSRLRREDFAFIAPRSRADDVLSCNNAPSSATSRGHQFPVAFLLRASGLEGHGTDSARALAYTHLDIGGSGVEGGDWQHGRPTAAPVLALAGTFFGL